MPIVRKIFDDGSNIVVVGYGHLTCDEVFDYLYWLTGSHRVEIKDDWRQLFDARPVTNFDLTEEDIRRVAQINAVYGKGRGDVQTAIVAVDPYARRLAKLHQSLSMFTSIEVDIFSTEVEAAGWLDMPVNYVEKTKELIPD